MGLYRDHVAPRVVAAVCGARGFHHWRERVCADLTGVVVEIGFGAGHNVPFLPTAVERLYGVEPAAYPTRLAAARIATSPVPVELVGTDGHSLALPDGCCDAALVTFTLCTVARPDEVLAELSRVLTPKGTIHFLEHGLAPDASVARWQRRLDPLEVRLADGCHLTRDPVAILRAAGFEIEWVRQRYGFGPRPWGYFSYGVARRRPD